MKTKNLNGNFNVVVLNIKKYRELNNLSQRELSDNLYHSDISRIESLQLFVRDYVLKNICKILNITLEQIMKIQTNIIIFKFVALYLPSQLYTVFSIL